MATRKLLQLFALCVVAGLGGCGGGDAPAPAPAVNAPPPPPAPPPPTTTTAQSCADPGGTEHGASSMVAADTLWSAAGSPHRGGVISLANAQLMIEAGAVVCVEAIAVAPQTWGTVHALGTEQAPIRFFGTALLAYTRLAHVQGQNMPEVGPAFSIEDSTLSWTEQRDRSVCMQVQLEGDGGAVRRSVIAGYGSTTCPALAVLWPAFYYYGGIPTIEARIQRSIGDAVNVGDPWTAVRFTNCEISSSGGRGIHAPPATGAIFPAVISGCNLFGNSGDAVANQNMAAIDARGNWWGDAAGPGGPNGGTVSGSVDASLPLAALATLGY